MPSQAIAQFTRRAFSSDQSRWLYRNSRTGSAALSHGSDKSVPAAVNCLNEKRLLRTIPQRAPDIEDHLLYSLRLDMNPRPYSIQEFILRHEPSRVLHQIAQDCKRLGG